MKNKSTRHKDDNTFKFQPFTERISNLDINVFHRIGHEFETQNEEEQGCFFYQIIEKWNVLNLTESYGDFKKEVKPNNNITLAQLIHNKDNVIEILLKHLKYKNVLCLQPLLELVVALVQDLQTDFYQYYPDFANVLIDLLNTKDADQLEWTFTCLAYIFKLLWRSLIKDINNVFDILLPLLSDTKPEYINNFAAESFAFVARKVKDRKAFILLILKTVKDTKDGILGTGRLLFEIINGINGQFHSCSEIWITLYFELLEDCKISNTLFKILEEVILHIVNNIHPRNSEVFWKIIINCLHQPLLTYSQENKDEYLHHILQCLGQVIENRSGYFLLKPNCVIKELLQLFSIVNLPGNILLSAVKIVVLLLHSKNIKLQQEEASSLTRSALNIKSKDVFLFFIENTFEHPSFEALILPTFLKYCANCELDGECLRVLAKLVVIKSPLCDSGADVEKWHKYPLNFNSTSTNDVILQILLRHAKMNHEKFCSGEEAYIYSVMCLPHVVCESEKIETILSGNFEILCELIKQERDLRKNLFLLWITFESMTHMDKSKLINFKDKFEELILPLCTNIKYISALKVFDLYLTVTKDVSVNMENLMVIHKILEQNFNSPYHEIRVYTTHIYSLFDEVVRQQFTNSLEEWNLFSLCYKSQLVEAHVHTYREQLIYLDKLNFDRPQMSMCKTTEFKTIPLRLLCGALYINFKLLWDPVIKIISSHATGLDMNTFWEVFVEELKGVVDNISKTDEAQEEIVKFDSDFLNSTYSNVYKISVKPDFHNYRLLLWKALCLFPDIAEAKTRDVSALLLSFVEHEYLTSNSENALTWNIKQNEPVDLNVTMEDNLDESTKEEIDNPQEAKRGSKQNIRTLLQHLQVFSKIRSAMSMYREPELRKLYFDLLSHKSADIQKMALDCIMTYRFKYVAPYKDHLYSLADDKNFKNELVAFKLDEESAMIQEEHRGELIPVIMKIVFSKMMSKTGLRTGGKSSGQFRRNIVFRFLAGCRKSEMLDFLNMVFKYYNKYLMDDPVAMVNEIISNVDLEKFIPPKRLQSTLNLINVILEQFGALMGDELIKYLLKIILTIGAFIRAGFEQQHNLHAGYMNLFRNLRTASIKIVDKIFSLFENYPWTSEEINAIYDVFIWPHLKKLPIEGIHSPTALLKLLITWGSNPRYFSLLVKHYDGDIEYYPLSKIISLLLNEKSNVSVCSLIMEMLEKLLTLQPDEDDLQLVIPVDNELPIREELKRRLKSKEAFNYGSCILLPHASSVLEKIKKKLEGKSKNVNQRELLILSRISELVWEAEISDTLLQILLPIVAKRCAQNASEEVLLQLMTTLNNLLANVVEPEKHLKKISPLFGEIIYPSARKLLCQLLRIISNGNKAKYAFLEEIMTNINAWDSKWIDQPDFQVRSDTFKRIQASLSENKVDLELGIPLIYNCFYLLKSEKDLALKENATHCLKTLAPYLVNNHPLLSDRNYILDETLLNMIRNGFKSKSVDVRNECISLLGYLCRECAEAHVVLRDLKKLTNAQDLEVDFFENLTHLQVHRHARALLKFSNIYKQETTMPNIRSLTQFILPLTTYYLYNDKYVNKHSMIDAAIETVGTICRLLPWHQYEGLLKYYLGKLRQKVDYQKQLVKLIVTILDSFHFDLSKGHENVFKKDLEDSVNAIENDRSQVAQDIHQNESTTIENGEDQVNTEESDTKLKEDENKEEVEVEEVLDNLEKEQDGEESDDENEEKLNRNKADNVPIIYEKITVLCKSAATRVIQSVQTVLLPQLHKTLAEMTHHDTSHKVNRKKVSAEREEEDLLRVPISLALVKLLQKLPKEILDFNLPGIFMKLCTFLKSHLESVRRVTRETLQKIMLSLGPSYLSLLLDEMIPLLTRGFQVHVLVYTMHAVLVTLKDLFKPKDVDGVLVTVIKLCKADLFGVLADEREVDKIISKVSEAKSSKSFDTFHILGQYITEQCLMDLLLPVKEILSTSQSFKIVNKAQECLRHIALGLVDNAFLPVGSLLKFSFGISSESIPELLASDQPVLSAKEREKLERFKPDCFIIPKEPVYRSGHRTTNVKSSSKANAHIMVEFGLRLCHLLLRRDKIRDDEFRPYLDPFVPIFKNCLTSKNVKLSVMTLQCLGWIFKYDLPSLKENTNEIAKLMFEILHKYGAAGLSKGDNFDLVVAAFKAMTVLVRDVKYFLVDEDQLKILLLYVEQDLHDHDRQATAFGLLKAILSRKLASPVLYDIMTKVAEMSITSELPHVRLQSRLVSHQFLMDYPLGKHLDKHVTFYMAQLKYETQTGRESAIEMMQTLINSFPLKVLKEYSGTFLITLGARLINDTEPNCRKMVADCINSMLSRMEKSDRDPLFNIMKVWLSEENVLHKRLAAQLCGILVTVEKASFDTRIVSLLPLIKSQFGPATDEPGKFVRLKKEGETESEKSERMKDHHLFQVLQLLLKISAQCPMFLKQIDDVEQISKSVQLLLGHAHEWVRLGAAQFLGFVLSSLDVKKLQDLLENNQRDRGYLHTDPMDDIKSLALDLCDQLQPNSVKSDLAEQVVKNLVFIARALENVPVNQQNKINLVWLAKRVRKIVNAEIVEAPKSTVLRTEVFKWIAGVVTALELKNLNAILHHLLAPLVREMITTEESDAPIRQLSKEVGAVIKRKIGMEKYAETLAKLQQHLSVKRAERKRSRNQLAVTDPEVYAKKKIKHHEKKKEAKKRKISERKGSVKKFKRKKVVDLDSSEIM